MPHQPEMINFQHSKHGEGLTIWVNGQNGGSDFKNSPRRHARRRKKKSAAHTIDWGALSFTLHRAVFVSFRSSGGAGLGLGLGWAGLGDAPHGQLARSSRVRLLE